MFDVQEFLSSLPIPEVVQTDALICTGDKVGFGLDGEWVEGTVRQMLRVNSAVFADIELDSGETVRWRAREVSLVSDWRDRVDPCLAESYGDGSGPLPIRLHPDSPAGPAVQVSWMHGSVLLVGIYTTARKGSVYRWDKGLDQAPTVILWDLDGPECQS